MRNPIPGELIYEWKDFEFNGLGGTIHMTKENFENHYGDFEAMILPENAVRPYAIWSKEYVVLFLDEDPFGIASITRYPSVYMFG